MKKLFLKILQYSQESTCAGISFLIKMQAISPETLLNPHVHEIFLQRYSMEWVPGDPLKEMIN